MICLGKLVQNMFTAVARNATKNTILIVALFGWLCSHWTLLTIADEPTILELQSPPKQVVLAGGASYIALAVVDPPTCVIVDVKSRTIIKELRLKDQHCLIAGTLSHLLVIDPTEKTLDRWSLSNWDREPTIRIPMKNTIVGAASGSFSDGPLCMAAIDRPQRRADSEFLMTHIDPFVPMKMINSLPNRGHYELFGGGSNALTASGDGCLFEFDSGLRFQAYGTSFRCMKKSEISFPDFSGATSYGKNGRFSFRDGSVSRIPTLPSISEKAGSWTPAMDSEWSVIHRPTGGAEILPPGSTDPAFVIPRVSGKSFNPAEPISRRLYLISSKSTLLETTTSNVIRLHRFNIKAPQLKGDFLHSTSAPQTSIEAGKKFEYQIEANSSTKEFTVGLALGPAGMVLESNDLKWDVPANSPTAVHNVVLQLSNSLGLTFFHCFRLRVAGSNVAQNGLTPKSEVIHLEKEPNRRSLAKEKWSEILLPAIPNAMTSVGGSRYLAIAYPDVPMVDLVDVATRTVRSLPLPFASPFHLAGTASNLFLVSSNGTVFVFRLENLELQRIKTIPNVDKLIHAIAGTYGNGPIGLVSYVPETYSICLTLLDEQSLEPLKKSEPFTTSYNASVSSDGRVFSFLGQTRVRYYDVAHFDVPDENPVLQRPEHWHRPNFNGSLFYSKNGIADRDGVKPFPKRMATESAMRTVVPSLHGNFFVAFEKLGVTNVDSHAEATVYATGWDEPILKLNELPVTSWESFQAYESGFAISDEKHIERIKLIPEYQTLAILPPCESKLYFRDFDLDQALRDTNSFVVDSVFPANAYQGKTYSHTIEVVGVDAPYEFALESAPDGARMEKNTIVWKVPAKFPVGVVNLWLQIKSNTEKVVRYPVPIQVTKNIGAEIEAKPAEIAKVIEKSEIRNWIIGESPKAVRGSFVRLVEKKTVEIMLSDGSITRVPINDLSLDDIEYVLARDIPDNKAREK